MFTPQGRLFCMTKPYFPEQKNIIFVGIFFKICDNLPCYPKYNCNLWLYSTLMESDFNEKRVCQNQNLDGKHTHVHGYLLYTKFHKGQSQEGVKIGPPSIA